MNVVDCATAGLYVLYHSIARTMENTKRTARNFVLFL